MSSVKLSQQERLDVHAQAKILVTVAVVANLLLALVLSLMLIFKPKEASAEHETAVHPNIGYLSGPDLENRFSDLALPAPADW